MKTKSLGLIAGVALLISMLSGGPASADTLLPDYSWDTSHLCAGATQFCFGTNKVFPANTKASYTDQYGTTSVTASETFSSTSSPILSATATAATSNANANAEASLNFTYYIEFTGPSGVVPVTVNTNGTTTVGGANAGLVILLGLTSVYDADVGGGTTYVYDGGYLVKPGTLGTSFTRSDTVDFTEGVIYRVGLTLSVYSDSTTPTATASVDPYFQYPSNYSLFTSSGVGNSPFSSSSTTPLPAALPLFASGLGALGLLGWRRKRKNAALAA
jgi:hypothetical protein